MGRMEVRHRTSYNKARLSLFIRSYAAYSISCYIRNKYKVNDDQASIQLKKRFSTKRSIPEITRLSRVLNFDYQLLWQFIIMGKTFRLNSKVKASDEIKVYLDIENELILLAIAKQNRSNYADPDYESEFSLLSVAIERSAGNKLKDMEDDYSFGQQCEELQRQYIYGYYKTAYRYKLLTIRIVPFVLRLIS